MRTPSNHWKLGLFVVVGFGLFLAALVFLGAQSFDKKTVGYVTYLDESVQGLDVGSPVKYRGVTIGNVSAIRIAPDRRHVEVACELDVHDIDSLGLAQSVPPDLRMQLGSTGLVGTKFVQLDFFDPVKNPPPALPFPTRNHYIPAAPSTMKNLEDAVVKAVDRIPDVAEKLVVLMTHANDFFTDVDRQRLPEQAAMTLARANDTLASIHSAVTQANLGKLSAGAQRTIDELTAAVTHLGDLLAKVDGDRGLIASAQRATDSIGDLAGGAKGLGSELQDTLRDIREAVDGIQRLAEALDTDSDMLLKGRARRRE